MSLTTMIRMQLESILKEYLRPTCVWCLSTPVCIDSRSICLVGILALCLQFAVLPAVLAQHGSNHSNTVQQCGMAKPLATDGVPLSELVPDAPKSYAVKRGDTLWYISTLFLRTPWRWPELWGMSLEEIRNPHLIYPGQVLHLEKVGDRAHLRVADESGSGPVIGTDRLSTRTNAENTEIRAVSAIPMHLILPALGKTMTFNSGKRTKMPRTGTSQKGNAMPDHGDIAYVPHAPSQPISGKITDLSGDVIAGQNQIVVLNKGSKDGLEHGHVLVLLRTGRHGVTSTKGLSTRIKLPNECHGALFVFQVFDRTSRALVMEVEHPVTVGDRFRQP